jgi:hypothetical protein
MGAERVLHGLAFSSEAAELSFTHFTLSQISLK